jgi:hypothetical protein
MDAADTVARKRVDGSAIEALDAVVTWTRKDGS